jgi:hypothetical protein
MNKADQMQQERLQKEFEARIQPDRKTVLCSDCGEPHGLWYRMSASGKKSLMFTCNKQKHFWWTNDPGIAEPVEHWKYVTRSFQAPVFIDGLDLYVDWTPAKKKDFQKKNQHQLPLMK